MFKQIGTVLYERVWVSRKYTILGLLVAVAIELFDYFTGALTKAHPALAPTLATIASLGGAWLRSEAAILATRARQELEVVPPPPAPPSAGFARLGLLLVLAVVCVGWARMARADEPRFGGCLADKVTCFGPSVSISLVALDLKDGSITTGVAPGLGYGVTWFTGKWYVTGVSAYATFRDTSLGQRLVASGVFSFAEYARVGLGYQVGGKDRPFLLLGVGANFGSAPSGG